MKKFWKKCIGLLLLSGVLLIGFLAGCTPEEKDPALETTVPELSLSTNSLTLLLGDEARLTASYYTVKDGQLSFSSSDASVASVDASGKVTALKEGTATVTASYGGEQVGCAVTVWLGEMLPMPSFAQHYEDGVSVAADESADLSVVVSFNGKRFTDAVVEYEVEDPTLGAISDGEFMPAKAGETQVTATAVWRGIELEPIVITVNVVEVFEIFANDGRDYSFTLYTIDSFAGQSFEKETPFVAHAKKNGVAVETKVEIVDGADVVSYEAGKLFALKKGEATVRVSCTDEETRYADFPVSVIVPVAEWSEKIEFSAADGDLPVEELFWQGAQLTEAYQGETQLTVSDNKVLGVTPNIIGDQTNSSVEPDSVTVGDTELIVYTATAGIKLSATAYTKIINTADDLRALNLSAENPLVDDKVIYGYFVLGGDIAYDEEWTPNTHSSLKYDAGAGFFGVFDGRGYSMEVNSYGDGGLFGRTGRCCIKNLSVTLREQAKNTGTYGFAYAFGNGAWGKRTYFRNVEITVENYGAASWKGNASAVLACEVQHYVDMKNVTITVNFADGKEEKNTGLLFLKAKNHSAYIVFDEVYVITDRTDLPLTAKDSAENGWAENDGQSEFVYQGLKRYESVTAMKNDAEANGGYSSFDNGYWQIDSGVPVWKGKNEHIS